MSSLALPALPQGHPHTLARGRRRSASFGDVVHARWYHMRNPKDEAARMRYEEIRELFEAENGKIVDVYWPSREPAGLALCCLRLSAGRLSWALHRTVGNLSDGRPEYSSLLLRVARESVHASVVLRGMTQRVAIANLFSLTRDIMASLEKKAAGPDPLDAFRRDLLDVATYIRDAGANQAQILYLKGVMVGVVTLVALAPLLATAPPHAAVPGTDVSLLACCLVAGSFGAAMSVLIRMGGGKFDISHEVGREYVTNRDYVTKLGFARPFIGAVFALLLYFALEAGLLQRINVPATAHGKFAFFIASGFAIGFSERFAKEIARTAESAAGGIGSATEQPVAK
jgi:hypothetical protein